MDPSKSKKPFHTRLAEKFVASRFFTFSALIHAVVLFLIGSVVLFKHYAQPPDFAASEGRLVVEESRAEAPPEQSMDLTEQTFLPAAPRTAAPTWSAITTTSLSVPIFHVAETVPLTKELLADSRNKPLVRTLTGPPRGVTGRLPPTMAARLSAAARAQAMMINGGRNESEEAVLRGLRWLKQNQNPDGSWGPNNKAAMTGFAMLSFLGHGETPVSPEFGPTVQRALEWIVRNGAEFEGRLSMKMDFSDPGVYEHAIATYALAEYYTMTRDERVVDLLTRAVGYILDGQSPDGGWVYGYLKDGPGDTSVSGWQIQALKAAYLTELNIPGVVQAVDKAMLNLKRVQGPQGGFGYRGPEDRYSLTGVGVFCTYFWRREKNQSVRDGIGFMMAETDKEYPVKYQGEKADLYAWYYNTQACLMFGGVAWAKWNSLFQSEITKAQMPDGSWPPMKAKDVGGLQLNPAGTGPLYRTNLCILMLEVYYRYLPSTR